MERNEKQSSLKISEDVIATIAKLTAEDIEGVSTVSVPQKTMKEFLTKPKVPSAIEVELLNDVAQITISVTVEQGHLIKPIYESIQTKVKEAVQSMTGIAVSKVNVIINNITFPEEK